MRTFHFGLEEARSIEIPSHIKHLNPLTRFQTRESIYFFDGHVNFFYFLFIEARETICF